SSASRRGHGGAEWEEYREQQSCRIRSIRARNSRSGDRRGCATHLVARLTVAAGSGARPRAVADARRPRTVLASPGAGAQAAVAAMTRNSATWAVVLAAGDGTRLAALTTDASGNSVPKQFCSLNGGSALIHETLQRAQHVAAPEHVCAIVAQQHALHWRGLLASLPKRNVIVQPENRGTANGVLLSVLSILQHDPLARIVFLPADHFVLDENALARALRDLVGVLNHNPEGLTLIGIE